MTDLEILLKASCILGRERMGALAERFGVTLYVLRKAIKNPGYNPELVMKVRERARHLIREAIRQAEAEG